MLSLLLAYLTLLTLAVLRRDGGQGIAAGLLFGNWLLCSAFVHWSGCDFPWVWYLTVDWLTAITLWIDRDTGWQRALIATFAVELLLHGAFAYATRDADPSVWSRSDAHLYWTQWLYWRALTTVAWAQVALVGSWIAYDAARDRSRRRRRVSSALAGHVPQAGEKA